MRRYLLASDGSASALQAARWLGREVADETDVHVTILHVSHPVAAYGTHTLDGAWFEPDVPLDVAVRNSCEPIFRAAREALNLPPDRVDATFRLGHAAEEIAREVVEGSYDAVVLGRGSAGRRLHRHLSDLLLRSVQRPVITVPEAAGVDDRPVPDPHG